MLTAVLLAGAIFAVYQIPDAKLTGVQKLRLLTLFLGATFGLAVALIGLALPFFHRFSTVFAGGGEAWRKNPLQILVPVIAFIAGLGLTFVSLQMGRGQERESAVMRRVLYGFNAVFSTLLLAAILLLVNVLPYLPQLGAHDFVHKFLDANFDWTQSRIYSLSDRTKNTLTSLKEPVKVYILLDNGDPLTEQVLTLLQNCQAVDPRLTWEQISSLSFARVQEMPQKLREKITDSHGLLVVYGDEAQGQAQFIRRDKLFTTQPDETGAGLGKVLFQGEGALLQTIRSLTENAEKKPVVYFAQGDGELDFNDGREDSADGMGVITRTMRKTEVYDLKELKFAGDVTEVPADADAVVVARPQRMKPAALKAIYNYMGYDYDETAKQVRDLPADKAHKAGKLFVLLDVQVQDKQMMQTGLEPLLRKFGAEPGDGRVLTLQDPRRPTDIDAAMSRSSRNPVAKAFAAPNRVIFHFTDVRPMRRLAGAGRPVHGRRTGRHRQRAGLGRERLGHVADHACQGPFQGAVQRRADQPGGGGVGIAGRHAQRRGPRRRGRRGPAAAGGLRRRRLDRQRRPAGRDRRPGQVRPVHELPVVAAREAGHRGDAGGGRRDQGPRAVPPEHFGGHGLDDSVAAAGADDAGRDRGRHWHLAGAAAVTETRRARERKRPEFGFSDCSHLRSLTLPHAHAC